KGVVYFDDLRLTMPICRPEYGPTGDLSGDCVVGMADFGEMTEEWLEHDVNFADEGIDIEEPCDANLAGDCRRFPLLGCGKNWPVRGGTERRLGPGRR
ncbi:MAG: hypothetical protein ACYSUV_14425, partial [Planctomycetota bacterium]